MSSSIFDQLGDRAKSAFADIGAGAEKAFDAITHEINDLKNTEAGKKIVSQLDALQSRLEAQAKEFAEEKQAMLKKFEDEKRQALISFLSGKISASISALMTIIVVQLKEFLTEDPYMPQFVKGAVRTIIDAVWPDISDELRENILSIAYSSEKTIDHGAPGCFAKSCCTTCCCGEEVLEPLPLPPSEEDDHCCCCQGCCCKIDCGSTPCFGPIAYLLYIQFPYDETIWQQIRKPMWWVLTIITAIPVYGISTLYYIFLFLITDKEDEFQLMNFIRSFKCLQFVSVGVISAMVAGGQLAVCTQSNPTTCSEYAPREQLHTIFLFVAQLIVCWIAFFFLGCAKAKGGLRYQLSAIKADKIKKEAHEAEKTFLKSMMDESVAESLFEEQTDGSEQRARLRNLMIYDLVVFLICAGCVAWAAFANLLDPSAEVTNSQYSAGDPFLANGKNWKFQMILFFCKTLYGLASFPWLLLMIPGVSALFSKAKPTAINPYGHTVPYLGVAQENVPWRRRKTQDEIVAEGAELERRQEVKRQKMAKMLEEEEAKRQERIDLNNTRTLLGSTSPAVVAGATNKTSMLTDDASASIQLMFYNQTLANPGDYRTLTLSGVSLKSDTQRTLKDKVLRLDSTLSNEGEFFLAFDGKYLNDGGDARKTLEQYGIQNESIVQVIRQRDIVVVHDE